MTTYCVGTKAITIIKINAPDRYAPGDFVVEPVEKVGK